MTNGNASFKWRGFGDSEIGVLHQRLGLPNQDAYSLDLEASPLHIVVSDGLGSKTLSHLGSQAVTRAVKKIADYYIDGLKVNPLKLINLFHKFWLEELQGFDINQCRCTVIFAIVWKEQTLIAQLGDGECCIVTSKQSQSELDISFLTQEDEDLFINQTDSLGQKLELDQWHFCIKQTAELEACFLVTDGIAEDLMPELKTQFYLELLSQYQNLTDDNVVSDIRHWISHWPVLGHSDDRTIVALFRQYL